jgi:alpha-methylacyl-CoA racemase
VPPLNLVADFGGGALFLVVGVLAALTERAASGRGQVVDAAMVDGAALLMSMTYSWYGSQQWVNTRGSNLLDGGAPFYTTYECADGKYVSVGALEPKFFTILVETLGLAEAPAQTDLARWPELREMFAAAFRTKTRDEWAAVFDTLDACVAPILDLDEAPAGEHLAARGTFTEAYDVVQPQPAPRFSRTPGRIQSPPAVVGDDVTDTLHAWGLTEPEIASLIADGTVTGPSQA